MTRPWSSVTNGQTSARLRQRLLERDGGPAAFLVATAQPARQLPIFTQFRKIGDSGLLLAQTSAASDG